MKKENPLIVSLDGIPLDQAKELTKELKPYVWGFKMNDLFFHPLIDGLFALNPETKWFIDLKLHDIPNTVRNQIRRLRERVVFRADLLTIHASGGPEMMLAAIEEANREIETAFPYEMNILAVTVLSSLDEFCANEVYYEGIDTVVPLAHHAVNCGVKGIVCAPQDLKKLENLETLKVVPGIRPNWYPVEDDQKRSGTPAQVRKDGGDFLVVGRPIVQAEDPIKAAQLILEEWHQ